MTDIRETVQDNAVSQELQERLLLKPPKNLLAAGFSLASQFDRQIQHITEPKAIGMHYREAESLVPYFGDGPNDSIYNLLRLGLIEETEFTVKQIAKEKTSEQIEKEREITDAEIDRVADEKKLTGEKLEKTRRTMTEITEKKQNLQQSAEKHRQSYTQTQSEIFQAISALSDDEDFMAKFKQLLSNCSPVKKHFLLTKSKFNPDGYRSLDEALITEKPEAKIFFESFLKDVKQNLVNQDIKRQYVQNQIDQIEDEGTKTQLLKKLDLIDFISVEDENRQALVELATRIYAYKFIVDIKKAENTAGKSTAHQTVQSLYLNAHPEYGDDLYQIRQLREKQDETNKQIKELSATETQQSEHLSKLTSKKQQLVSSQYQEDQFSQVWEKTRQEIHGTDPLAEPEAVKIVLQQIIASIKDQSAQELRGELATLIAKNNTLPEADRALLQRVINDALTIPMMKDTTHNRFAKPMIDDMLWKLSQTNNPEFRLIDRNPLLNVRVETEENQATKIFLDSLLGKHNKIQAILYHPVCVYGARSADRGAGTYEFIPKEFEVVRTADGYKVSLDGIEVPVHSLTNMIFGEKSGFFINQYGQGSPDRPDSLTGINRYAAMKNFLAVIEPGSN